MRNVTITLDEETALWARMEAARRDTSVSRLVGQMLREKMNADVAYEQGMQRFLAVRPVKLKGRTDSYPSRDEIHDRDLLR